jgi:GT2 family glycosyltransferase
MEHHVTTMIEDDVVETGAVTAIICTKDRVDDIVRAVSSLVEDETHEGAIIVVDQSDGEDTRIALGQFDDERLHYVRSETTGKGGALNEGLALARSRFVVCTDDDCEPSPGWSRLLIRPMEGDPRIALAFSRVVAPEHDREKGYIPVFPATHDRVITRPIGMRHGWGLGASMGIRRKVLVDLGGFDHAMGPGGRFASADDFDVELRLLLKGFHVYENAAASVTHYGYRTRAEGRAHTVRDWYGLGASCAKAVRAKHIGVLRLSTSLLWRRAIWPSVKQIVRFRRPPLRRVWAFTTGFFCGIRHRVDPETLLYVLPAPDPRHPD